MLDRLVDQIDRELDREEGPLDFPTPRVRPQEVGFWADDEEDEFAAQVEDADDDWQPEHITSVAESELEVHREIREYYRVIAWDMPLLKRTYLLACGWKRLWSKSADSVQNLLNHFTHRMTPHRFGSGTRRTWGKCTLPRRKLWSNSAQKI